MVAPPADRKVFSLPIRVGKEHIDDLDHVNNVVYVSWVQDVAAAHWTAAATAELRNQCRLVVMRHEIDYLASAMEGELLEALTWVDPAQGARQVRHVIIRRASDQKSLAEAQTTWCLLDPGTGKPKRIGPEIEAAIRLKD